jgi:hypothetical protein
VSTFSRVSGGLALLALAAFCGFGFLASLEPGAAADPLPWQVGYGVAFHLALGGAVMLLRGAFLPARGEGRAGQAAPPVSWPAALGLAVLLAWLPSLVMAVHMQLTVSPGHCTTTAWRLAPIGPGLLPATALLEIVEFPERTEAVWFTTATCLSLGLAVAVARLLQRGGAWAWGAATVALAATTAAAVATHHLIRM